MSAKHHSYLRSERELTFKARGLRLDLRLRRGHLPGDTIPAVQRQHEPGLWREPRVQSHVQPRARLGLEATAECPSPRCCCPSSQDEGWKSHRAGSAAPPGSTWPGAFRQCCQLRAAPGCRGSGSQQAGCTGLSRC